MDKPVPASPEKGKPDRPEQRPTTTPCHSCKEQIGLSNAGKTCAVRIFGNAVGTRGCVICETLCSLARQGGWTRPEIDAVRLVADEESKEAEGAYIPDASMADERLQRSISLLKGLNPVVLLVDGSMTAEPVFCAPGMALPTR